MRLFDLIKGIKDAKVQGLKLNTYCASVKAFKGAIRGMIFKYWNRVIVPVHAKTITVSRDPNIDGIFNIVDNKHGLRLRYTHTLLKTWTTSRNLYDAADFYGFKVVII